MTQNEHTEDIDLETQDDEIVEETEETTDDESTDETEEEESEEGSEPTAEEKLKAKDAEIAKLRRILAKKGKQPAAKPNEESQNTTSKTQPNETVEETVLKAQGMAPELLKELKAIAKVRGVGLIEAQSDILFKTIKTDFEKKQKIKDASLGSSKGSGTKEEKKTFSTPNIPDDEHEQMFNEAMGINK